MVVKTHRDGRDRTGLHIGAGNARRYFRKHAPSIDLKLDDLQIQCTLSPDFWDKHPEIHDPRLSEWLNFKVGHSGPGRDPMLLTMIPSGADTYVVRPRSEKNDETFGAEVSPSTKLPPESVLVLRLVPALQSRSVA